MYRKEVEEVRPGPAGGPIHLCKTKCKKIFKISKKIISVYFITVWWGLNMVWM